MHAARRGSRLRCPSGRTASAAPVASATASPTARERQHGREVAYVPEDPVNPLPGLPRNVRRGGKPDPMRNPLTGIQPRAARLRYRASAKPRLSK
jgi:hypothetical protein